MERSTDEWDTEEYDAACTAHAKAPRKKRERAYYGATPEMVAADRKLADERFEAQQAKRENRGEHEADDKAEKKLRKLIREIVTEETLA